MKWGNATSVFLNFILLMANCDQQTSTLPFKFRHDHDFISVFTFTLKMVIFYLLARWIYSKICPLLFLEFWELHNSYHFYNIVVKKEKFRWCTPKNSSQKTETKIKFPSWRTHNEIITKNCFDSISYERYFLGTFSLRLGEFALTHIKRNVDTEELRLMFTVKT